MEIKILESNFCICKVEKMIDINMASEYLFIGQTNEEISVVCDDNHIPTHYTEISRNWRCMKIMGILDFSLIGILSKITTILAEKHIGIFVVSTYNTDYILVKEDKIALAQQCLEENGYSFI